MILSIGARLFPGTDKVSQTILGALTTLALMSILGSVLFYVTRVTTAGLMAIIALIAVLAYAVWRRENVWSTIPRPDWRSASPLFALGLVSLGAWWSAVPSTTIEGSVRTPWSEVPPFAILALVLAALMTLLLFTKNERGLGITLLGLTLFSALSMAAALYPLGYGFDPFLHRATVTHILEHGTITPKPLYYIGQYILELFAVRILHLPLFAFDVFLAPVLAALALPVAFFAYRRSGMAMQASPLLLLPLGAFIQTTPQALAFIFTALVVFLSFPLLLDNKPLPWFGLSLFAVAALFMHPLAGIMAVLFLVLAASTYHKALFGLMLLGTSMALPLAFTLQAFMAGLAIRFNIGTAGISRWVDTWIDPYIGTSFNAWGDMTYFFLGNTLVIITVLALIGVSTLRRDSLRAFVPLGAAGAAFMNFLLLSTVIDFSFLISYERTDFALRILTLVIIFLLPYTALFFERTLASRALTMFTLVLISAVFGMNVYGAYPRNDNYARSSGFNVTATDFEAVQKIENLSAGQDYVVLSNQATAAAAVQTLGFKKYYPGDIFFYPIPTGGELYDLFLQMSKEPSITPIEGARNLTGASTIYFVVSDYWWESEKVIENTKTLTDEWFVLGNGETTVFVFKP